VQCSLASLSGEHRVECALSLFDRSVTDVFEGARAIEVVGDGGTGEFRFQRVKKAPNLALK
jgi:hypothetical protein